ncbi:MAG: sulfite exporter TauE/SafE family protein [Pseudomonadota bacterium]
MHAAVALAAFFQTVTGVGFGMIAGPVILILLNDPSAILVSTMMSWLIAVLLAPALVRGCDVAMLRRLGLGALIGLPAGLALLVLSDVAMLKLLAGVTISVATGLMMFGAPGIGRPGRGLDLAAGALGGLFGGALAMPGPTPAIRMGSLGYDKIALRSTMVTFFVVVWPVILAGQVMTAGIAAPVAWYALSLVPATLVGLVIGQIATTRVSELFFRRLVLAFLGATAFSLIASFVADLSGIGLAP